MPPSLAGRTAPVTGVSRRRGIGFAVASRLAAMGASLAVHHHRPHDVEEYGVDGRVIWMTSGQMLGPTGDKLA